MTAEVFLKTLRNHQLLQVQGPGARALLEAASTQGAGTAIRTVPTSVFGKCSLPSAGFIACLGAGKYLLYVPLGAAPVSPAADSNTRVFSREDPIYRISGPSARMWLQSLTPVDLSQWPGDQFVMLRLFGITCWITPADSHPPTEEEILLGCDPSYGSYFFESLNASIKYHKQNFLNTIGG